MDLCLRDYNEVALLKEVLRNIGVHHEQGETIAELQRKLAETITGKSFFLVLDDVWHSNVWIDLLRPPLHATAAGTILATTRDEKIAMRIGVDHTHRVDLMSVEVGWELLWRSMNFHEEEQVHDLRNIGIEIIRKCGRLPLAIKVSASVLACRDLTENEWKKVLGKYACSQRKLSDEIEGALYLSYDELPHHLKQCFLYCALFIEDSIIRLDEVTWLWIAEGFVEEQQCQLLEDTAEEYYYELIHRNLLQPDNTQFDQAQSKMHDLLRQFACTLPLRYNPPKGPDRPIPLRKKEQDGKTRSGGVARRTRAGVASVEYACTRAVYATERLPAEELQDPRYATNNPAWLEMLAEDHEQRLHAYAGPRPPVKHNRARRHQIWDGRSFEDVVGPYRAQAAAGALPAPTSVSYGLFRRGDGRSTHVGFGGGARPVRGGARGDHGDARGSVRLGSGDRRSVASRGGRDGGSSRAPPPEPEQEPEPPLLAEYRRLAAEAGDPDDMPGYLTAIRESENAPVPPPLVQEYLQVAPAAGHPEDPPDFPGYHAAVADSMAVPVVHVGCSSNIDDDELLFDEEDFSGVEDD